MTSEAVSTAIENQRPLSESIAAATRSLHAKLNKLIIARLPQALPPCSADPSIYASGLLHVAPIYITFESLWGDIVGVTPLPPSSLGEVPGDGGLSDIPQVKSSSLPAVPNSGPVLKHRDALCERTRSLLDLLYLPGLMRSDRLRSDIASLTGWSPEVVDEHLKATSESAQVADFTQQIKRAVENKPHVLLAYSYILFMALFAGGRFIRATLESAGSEFWERIPSPIPPFQTSCQPRPRQEGGSTASTRGPVDLLRGESGTLEIGARHSRHTLPLSFFHFATVLDGEDLKKEFKKRLARSENLLTPRERHDIIQEAVNIFDNMLLLVGQLDDVCETDLDESSSMASWTRLGACGRLRDSVVVTRERRKKASSRGSEDSNRKQTSRLCKYGRQQKSETEEAQSLDDPEKEPSESSKSIRFETKLPVPEREAASKTPPTDGMAGIPSFLGSVGWPLSRSAIALISNILLVVSLVTIAGFWSLSRGLAHNGVIVDEQKW